MSNHCAICQCEVDIFLDFGPMPIANGFLTEAEFENEYFHPLKVGFCQQCRMVQLVDPVPPQKLFNENYPFFSGSSERMKAHFRSLTWEALERSGKMDKPTDLFVVEIGSNDGTLLESFQAHSYITTLGIEPSKKVAYAAQEKGVTTYGLFFGMPAAEVIEHQYGEADLIIATNTLCHCQNIHSVLKGVKHLLAPDGLFVFEDPYLPEIIKKRAYDQFYDEHMFYFTVNSVTKMLKIFNLQLDHIEPQDVHGGSMRYWVKHRNDDSAVCPTDDISFKELNRFADDVTMEAGNLVANLQEAKEDGYKIIGYGATSKSTTILNYGKIGTELIDYITDTTPEKQGKFSPGMHIPIVPPERFWQDEDVNGVLMLAWNHYDEIWQKDEKLRKMPLILSHSRRVLGEN